MCAGADKKASLTNGNIYNDPAGSLIKQKINSRKKPSADKTLANIYNGMVVTEIGMNN